MGRHDCRGALNKLGMVVATQLLQPRQPILTGTSTGWLGPPPAQAVVRDARGGQGNGLVLWADAPRWEYSSRVSFLGFRGDLGFRCSGLKFKWKVG